MLVLGQGALLVTLLSSLWVLVAGVLGGVKRSRGLADSAGRGLVASAALLTLATAALANALLTNDFAVKYVADYSSRAQGLAYKIGALWGGQGGSLMFWAFLLAVFGAVLAVRPPKAAPPELMPWVHAVMGGTLFFFTAVTVFAANPFALFPANEIPIDGHGLNPLLQNFWMLIHPPTLYLGYVGTTVPFAFALAALITGRLDGAWVRSIRRWTLFTFGFLTLGIWLGGYWAYIELGWGGFWAWDAVENASLMPWLVLTAFVHSIVAHEKRGLLKTWSIALIMVSFLLSVYGTFLTRSGIIQSVHAFEKNSIGNWFLVFLALAALVSFVALIKRLGPPLRPDAKIEAVTSREGLFLLGNLVLLGLTAIVFLLTMWPLISQVATGVQKSFEPPQFTQATRPLFLLLVVLMGLAPLASWRRAIGGTWARAAIAPAAIALTLVAALVAFGAREPWSLVSFTAVFFAAGTVISDLVRMVRARQDVTEDSAGRSLVRVLGSHRRRIGAYVSHLSVVLMVIGIAGSMAYKTDVKLESVQPGQAIRSVDGYELVYRGAEPIHEAEYDGVRLHVAVRAPGSSTTVIVMPEMRKYFKTDQPSSEVAILSTILPTSLREIRRTGEDLYVSVLAFEQNGNASIQVLVHPMVNWLWYGGVLLLIGTVIAYWPDRREPLAEPATDVVPSPAGAEPARP